MLTDKQILSALMEWKKENRFKTIDLQDKLGLPKVTFHRRVNNGGWTHKDIKKMKSLGILLK